jgi:hypothetical protein
MHRIGCLLRRLLSEWIETYYWSRQNKTDLQDCRSPLKINALRSKPLLLCGLLYLREDGFG